MLKLKKKQDLEAVDGEEEEVEPEFPSDLQRSLVPNDYVEVERYPLSAPYSYAVITQHRDTQEYLYVVDELQMEQKEKTVHKTLRELLEVELVAPSEPGKVKESYHAQLDEILANHKDIATSLPQISLQKVQYFLERDIVGLGKLEPIIRDPSVEDISCGGVKKPIFIWHKLYESVKTTVSFDKEQELDDFIVKMVHKGGRHVSSAFPIVDVMLPGKHRMAVLYKREVTPLGSSFTIRKFKEDPYTIVDLVESGTIDADIAAYMWLLIENKMSFMVLGATGAGKTTALNAITCLIQPTLKIFTVEEVAELNLPHENWFTLVARSGFGLESEGRIGLFDLIKSGVRHRPDYLVVGEVRGEEAYVLFQALATGHGGLCTMHAESVQTALKRLTQKPMNIPDTNLSLMNCALVVKRVSSEGKRSSVRRVVQVSEIYDGQNIRDIFRWTPSSDTFLGELHNSKLLLKIGENRGLTRDQILEELENRKAVLQWMSDHEMRDYKAVSQMIAAYNDNPERIHERMQGSWQS